LGVLTTDSANVSSTRFSGRRARTRRYAPLPVTSSLQFELSVPTQSGRSIALLGHRGAVVKTSVDETTRLRTAPDRPSGAPWPASRGSRRSRGDCPQAERRSSREQGSAPVSRREATAHRRRATPAGRAG
jgi:hypothetical protein